MPQIIKTAEIDYTAIIKFLKNGGVIIYPTDTAYALGADSKSAAGIKKIYKIKKRDIKKTLPLIAGSLRAVKKIALLRKAEENLAKKNWPGPLTISLSAKSNSGLAGGLSKEGRIAVRVPDSEAARRIALALGRPIVSTSANRTGAGSCYSIAAARKSLGKLWSEVDAVIDAGKLRRAPPSTIVKLKNKNLFTVLRQGKIKIKI